jgi:hypothetical protein
MNLRADVVKIARAAEEAGFTSLWVFERILVPVRPTQGLYDIPGLPWPQSYQHIADSLTVLTAAAVVTSQVRLGTSVLVAPLRVPTELARGLATLDLISGGRVMPASAPAGRSTSMRPPVPTSTLGAGRLTRPSTSAARCGVPTRCRSRATGP